MNFRTTFPIAKHSQELTHQEAFLLLGSCFSENIGAKLRALKFDCLINPLGISYNPISIHQLIQPDLHFTVQEQQGVYFSHQFHSELNQLTEEEYRNTVQRQHKLQQQQLSKGGTLILTYGTAWVYEQKEQKVVVNNCHKQPATAFQKRLLSIEEIVDSWNRTYPSLLKNEPQTKVVFTVSPVRHLKDGSIENQRSKSTLLLAISEICKQHMHCSYFPSYELMMDDLRDYRFYNSDLIHPNDTAIDYIWKQFEQCYFSEKTITLNKEINKLSTSIQHRAFQPESKGHQEFLTRLLQKLKQFQSQEGLDFKMEIEKISEQIK